jgi:CRISPR-associated endonuclease/helicase Cas3
MEALPNEVIVFKRLLKPNDRLEYTAVEEDEEDNLSERAQAVSLDDHTQHVVERVASSIARVMPGRRELFQIAAELHDLGKADARFQAVLAGTTAYEAMRLPRLLGKSGSQSLSNAEREERRVRAELPKGFRHEMLSTQIVEQHIEALCMYASIDRDLLLHVVAAHHGHARPFAPVVVDQPRAAELLSLVIRGISIDGANRAAWVPAHRLDSGIPERFWQLTLDHGWWGLAWLEAILRLADQQASAAEQEASK